MVLKLSRDRFYDFLVIFDEQTWQKYWRFSLKLLPAFAQILSLVHWFLSKTPIYSPKIGKNSRKLQSKHRPQENSRQLNLLLRLYSPLGQHSQSRNFVMLLPTYDKTFDIF
jgi:hypothetical protein